MTRLEQLRRSQFLSVRRLAELAKVKPNTISDIERGRTILPRRETMEALARALGVPLSDLADASFLEGIHAA